MRTLLYTVIFVATVSPVHCEIKVVCYDSTGPCNRHEKLQCSNESTILIKEVLGWFHQTGCTSCTKPTNSTCCNYKISDVYLGQRQSDKTTITEQCSSQSKCFPFDGLVVRNDSAGKQTYIAVDFTCEGSSNPVNSIVIISLILLIVVGVILVLVIVYCAKRNGNVRKETKGPDEEGVNKQTGNADSHLNHDKRYEDLVRVPRIAHNDIKTKNTYTPSKLKDDFDKSDELMDADFDRVTYSNSVVPCMSSLANEKLNKLAGPRQISENNKSLQLVNTLSCLGIEVSEHSKIKEEKTKSDKQSRAPTRRSKSMDNSGKRKTEISRRFTRGQTDSRFTEEQKFRKPTIKETAGISKTPNKLGSGFLQAEPELLDQDFDNIHYTKSPMSQLVVSDKRSEYYKVSPLRSSSVSRSSQLVNTLGCMGIDVSDKRSKNRKVRTRTSFNNHHLHEGYDTNHTLTKATRELPRTLTATAASYEELHKQSNNRSSVTKALKPQETAETESPFVSMAQSPPAVSSQHYKVDKTFIKDMDTAVIVGSEFDYMTDHYVDKSARNIKRSSSVPASYYYSHKHESQRDKTSSALHSKLQLKYKQGCEKGETIYEKPLSVTERKTRRKRKRSKSKEKQSPRKETGTDRNSSSNETNDHSETRNYFSNDQEYQEYIKSLKQTLNSDGQMRKQNSDVSMQDDEMSYHYEIQDDDEIDFDSNKGKPAHSVQNNINQDAGLKLDKEVDYTTIKTAVVRPLIQGKDKSRNLQNKYRSLSFSDTSKKIRAHEIKYSRNKSVFPYDARFSQFPGHNNLYHLHSKHRSTVPNTVSVANFLTANCSVEIPSSLSMPLMSYKMPNRGEPPEEQDANSSKNIAVPFSREMNTENFDKEPYGLEIPFDKEQDEENTQNDTDFADLEDHKPVQSGNPSRSSSFLIQPTTTKAKQINRSKSDRNRMSSSTS